MHLFIDGCNTDLQVQRILIHADIDFKPELTENQIAAKIKWLQYKLESLLTDHYFEHIGESNVMTDEAYEKMMSTNSL